MSASLRVDLPRIDPKTSIFRNDFAANHADLPGASLPWLSLRRSAAIDAFVRIGAPTRRVEAWKYTDIAGALENELEPATLFRGQFSQSAAFPGIDANTLTLVNGFLQPHDAVEGLEIVDLGTLDEAPDWVEDHLGARASGDAQVLGAASLALMRGGVAIRVRQAEKPLHLAFINPARGVASMSHARVLVVVEPNAKIILLESHSGTSEGDGQLLANLGVEIVARTGAQVTHTRLVAEDDATLHVTSLSVECKRDASYRGLYAALGGRMARLDANVRLAEPGASAEMHGVSVLDGTQLSDITVVMDHAAPHTTSRQLFKSVVGGRGRSVGQSRVTVREGAMKSDSHQLFKALLLGPRAEADAKPELEIYADDVICGHGTAIGALDSNALFYMRSRGLNEGEARALLVRAFLEDAIAGYVDEALHDAIWAKVDSALSELDSTP